MMTSNIMKLCMIASNSQHHFFLMFLGETRRRMGITVLTCSTMVASHSPFFRRTQDKGFIYGTQTLSAIEDTYMQPMQHELFRNKYYSLIFCADLFHDQSKLMNLIAYSLTTFYYSLIWHEFPCEMKR